MGASSGGYVLVDSCELCALLFIVLLCLSALL